MARTAPTLEQSPSPIPGDLSRPFLTDVASTYAGGGAYEIHRCEPSGLGLTFPFPTPDELDAIYASSYDYGAHTLIAGEKRWRARKLLDLAQHKLGRPIESALDVGCMYGYLLDELRLRGVRKAAGVELAREAASAARAKGFDVHQGTIEQYASENPGQRFDVIFAQHVLEHVPDPVRFLRCAVELLLPGGALVLAVPHFGSRSQRLCGAAWGWYQVPVHLFHFSQRSLAALCSEAGLVGLDDVRRGGDSLFVLMTMYHLVKRLGGKRSAEQAPRPLSPLGAGIVRAASRVMRPYFYLGDEELVMVARKPG
jgi:SAM-dependent methyltransferase